MKMACTLHGIRCAPHTMGVDGMVILSRSNTKAIMAIVAIIGQLLDKLKLSLNEEKSRITTTGEGFDFIDFYFFRRYITRKQKEVNHMPALKERSEELQGKGKTGTEQEESCHR